MPQGALEAPARTVNLPRGSRGRLQPRLRARHGRQGGAAYPGPSRVLAYSYCIAHGYDLRCGLRQQDLASASGYRPLFRYEPAMRSSGERPFRLDSPRPTIPFKDYAYNELRYRALTHTDPKSGPWRSSPRPSRS